MDKKQILSTLIIAGIIASVSTSVGAILDFRSLKSEVRVLQDKWKPLETKVNIVTYMMCKEAIKKNEIEVVKHCDEIISKGL